MLEDGYDTDMQLGPFYEDGVSDEVFVSMDEEAPEVPATNIAPPSQTENSDNLNHAASNSSNSELRREDIAKLKVTELRTELGKRGLSKNGLKKVLQDRLVEGIKKKIPLLQDRSTDEIDHDAGDGFAPGTFWKLLDPEPNTLDESIMKIDGVHFRAPTTTEEEQKSNFCERPKKRNYNQIFDRMPFYSKRLLPVKNEKTAKFKRKQNGEYYYKEQATNETVPNLEFLFSNGIGFDTHPAD